MSMFELLGTLEVGFIFGLVALGTFLTFRVLNIADLTVEGSFPFGGALSASLIVVWGVDPWLSLAVTIVAGFLVGVVTAWLNVRLHILQILTGILVAISLYSLNLRIMHGPNMPLLNVTTVFTSFDVGVPSYVANPIFLALVVLGTKLLLDRFLLSGIGLAMRAVGTNAAMAAANGVDNDRMMLLGVGIANALTALSGALFAQIFGSADVYMGIGVIIVGFASVIIGTGLLPSRTIVQATLACIAGAVLYRLAVAVALNADVLGFMTSDVQMLTAVYVVVVLTAQRFGFGGFLSRLKRSSS